MSTKRKPNEIVWAILSGATLAVLVAWASCTPDADASPALGSEQCPRPMAHTDAKPTVEVDRLGNVVITGGAESVLVYHPGEFTDLAAIAAAAGSRCAASYMNASDDAEDQVRTVICMPHEVVPCETVEPREGE